MTWLLTAISLFGNWLNCRKVRACFVLWIACNLGWTWIDITGGVYSRAILDAVQIGFSIYGLWKWGEGSDQK